VTGLRPGDIIEVEGLGLAVVTNFVWFLSKRDFIACVGEAAKTGWKGSGVAAAQVPEDVEPPVGNEYDEAGFRELAECGITAHDFAGALPVVSCRPARVRAARPCRAPRCARDRVTTCVRAARNVCAFNLRFLALAGAEELERVRLRRQDREERLAVAQRYLEEREAERQLAHDAARPDADLQRVNRYRHPSPPDSDDESSLLRINVASLLN